MDSQTVSDFLASSGLEAVGGELPDDPTTFQFTVVGGQLVQLDASGTHFHDGEALSITATVRYSPIISFHLQPPNP